MASESRSVLWWSRAPRDYSRDRVTRAAVTELGFDIVDFHPKVRAVAHWEARLRRLPKPACVWVPCFRQRDLSAAINWAASKNVPVIFDPLISAYDKQVFERGKFPESSRKAQRLKRWETKLFGRCDVLLADTHCHAEYFIQEFAVDKHKVVVVPVGADQTVFLPVTAPSSNQPLKLLFYGSFIELQAPKTIVQAVRDLDGVELTMIGNGRMRAECEQLATGCPHIRFLDKVPFVELPKHIEAADVVLGIFGQTEKAARVIPNKVYQALACGRAVVTRRSEAYPSSIRNQQPQESGIYWANTVDEIVLALANFKDDSAQLGQMAKAAQQTFVVHFSQPIIRAAVKRALSAVSAFAASTKELL